MFRLLLVLGLAALIAWGVSVQRDPYRTALPLEVADLSPLAPQLGKLPAADRELVLGYLERSHGDVLPAKFADPDEPLTARTFAEAINLQKQFLDKQAGLMAKLKAREAEREAALAPLRAALDISLVKREIVPLGELVGQPLLAPNARTKAALGGSNDRPIMVSTYRLLNNSKAVGIQSLTANVRIRKAGSDRYALGELSSCYITHDRPIRSGESSEIRCANTNRAASEADRAYLAMPLDDLVIDWEPQRIRFNDGQELVAND